MTSCAIWMASFLHALAVTGSAIDPATIEPKKDGVPTTAPSTQPSTQPAEQEPNPPRNLTFVGTESVALEVAKAKTGHLLVKPKIDSKDVGWWFFDTGAGINCIDTALADELKLAVLREGVASGMGGETATRYRAVETLELGPVRLDGSEMIELDLSTFEQFLGYKISGIIGHDTFFAGVFEIDHRDGTVTVFDPSTYELKDAQWTEMKLLDRRPSVVGRLENNPPGALMFDSGSNTGAIVTAPTVKAFDLLKNRELTTSLAGGVGGLRKRKAGTLETITIGNVNLKNVDTIFSEAVDGATAKDTHQAILGIPVLRQFVMIVNYPQMKLALKLKE